MITTEFACGIADRIRAEHQTLAARWFERLLVLLPVDAKEVFPGDNLLDHIPALILEIGEYLREPAGEAIAANTAILDKARELGALRHGQRASLHQVLREYQVLGGVLVTFVLEEMDQMSAAPNASDGVRLVSRLHDAVIVLTQATVETFVTLYVRTIEDQSARLEEFTRMASHEWRQPLGALQFGIGLLQRGALDPERTRRTLDGLERTVTHLVELTRKLETVARMRTDDSPVVQEVSLTVVASEAARQLREMADARGVTVRVAETLPSLTVDVGRLELTFLNLLSNAIKYSDPEKPARFVEITGGHDGDGLCAIEVRDNGIGIPRNALPTIFQRFTRGHTDREEWSQVTGVGLGLSIVEDCVHAMHGQIEVESAEGAGTRFVLRLPIDAGVDARPGPIDARGQTPGPDPGV
jgi:signal transduction histidine kinase